MTRLTLAVLVKGALRALVARDGPAWAEWIGMVAQSARGDVVAALLDMARAAGHGLAA